MVGRWAASGLASPLPPPEAVDPEVIRAIVLEGSPYLLHGLRSHLPAPWTG